MRVWTVQLYVTKNKDEEVDIIKEQKHFNLAGRSYWI